jgi:hypothetical protein
MRRSELEERQLWCPPVPADFPAHYEFGGYPEHQVIRIARKYLGRTENIHRSWARIHYHFPETVNTAESLDILEFSTAHGAMLEVWRHLGHRVRGTDFGGWHEDYNAKATKPKFLDAAFSKSHSNPVAEVNLGWIYQPIIESLGLEVDIFDAGALPYAYADKSFDVVCCYQAIEAYAGPEGWLDIAKEFCRIARKSVVIGFNPPPLKLRENEEHMKAARAATEALRSYNHDGFRSAFLEFGQTNAGYHPTAVKLIATGGDADLPKAPQGLAKKPRKTAAAKPRSK